VTEVCEEHGCDLKYHDFGDGESGPSEPTLVCPQCVMDAEPKCPKCGGAINVSTKPTRQYGGGYDTYEQCLNPECDYAEVFT
jgi:hypothetical protein